MKTVIFWLTNRSSRIWITNNPLFETNSCASFIRKCITLAAVVFLPNTALSNSRWQQQNTSALFDKNQDDPAKVRSKRQRKSDHGRGLLLKISLHLSAVPSGSSSASPLLKWSGCSPLEMGADPGRPPGIASNRSSFLRKGWLFPEGAVGRGSEGPHCQRAGRYSRLMFRSWWNMTPVLNRGYTRM